MPSQLVVSSAVSAIAQERAGNSVTWAVRKFPDRPSEPADTVCFSRAEADELNTHAGEVKKFGDFEDIFDNIVAAKEWIEAQLSEAESDVHEAEKRLQAALRRKRNDRRRLQPAKSEVAGGTSASSGDRFRKRKSTSRAEPAAGGGGDPDDGDGGDDPGDAPKGPSGRDLFRRRRRKGDRKGGLRSGVSRLLDKAQAKVELQLF